MKAVIFAGGVGTRLWPLSRKKSPKQFMNIVKEKTMLQLSVERLQPDFAIEDIYIATGDTYAQEVKQQISHFLPENIIAEPATRDVGPAVGLTTALFFKDNPDEPFALLWGADHLIKEVEKYKKIILTAGEILKENGNQMVLLGQKPRFASQNLGWIEYGDEDISKNGFSFCRLKGYKYRPDEASAESFFADGHHSWNLGYWVTTPRYLWKQFETFVPEIFAQLKKIQDAYKTPDFDKVLREVYPKIEKISFDNAIVEHMNLDEALVVTEDFKWSDVGAWEALKEALEESKDDNVTQGNVLLKDSTDSLVYNFQNDKLVVGIDLDDFLVVNTPDVLLVTKKTSIPKVKKVVESLEGTEFEKLT